MKVVINKCYGGFGLSKPAREKLTECGHCTRTELAKYYGKSSFDKERVDRECRGTGAFSLLLVDGQIVSDRHGATNNRTCPVLVRVVEEMGKAAFGDYANLAVVEIPDGVEFEIDEYDGVESIHETHRSWS